MIISMSSESKLSDEILIRHSELSFTRGVDIYDGDFRSHRTEDFPSYLFILRCVSRWISHVDLGTRYTRA